MTKQQAPAERLTEAATMFKALGDPTRLSIYLYLRAACCSIALGEKGEIRPVNGPTMGEVCCNVTGLDSVTPSISRHVRELRIAGLVDVEKRGRYMVCRVNGEAVDRLNRFLGEPIDCRDAGKEKS